MSTITLKPVTAKKSVSARWSDLYKIAGIATVISILFIPVQIVIYMLWPTPETAIESFDLFQNSKLLGLLSLELSYILTNLLVVPLYLAFYVALRRSNESLMAIATALGLIAVAVVIAARPAFDMLFLSEQYAAASTEAQKAIILSAGQARISSMHGTGQQVHYIIGTIALLMISFVMLRSEIFSKTTA